MTADTVLFLAFGVPFICFVAAWFLFFGKRDGAFEMTRRELLVVEAGLLFVALASFLLAADMGQRR
jgi:hypothetical protein